jgi:hypothetical protein
VAGNKRGPRRAECQLPVRGLVRVRLLHRLTRAALRWWLNWSPSCGLQWGLNWLTPSTLRKRLESLTPSALRRRLGWLALQWRLRTGFAQLHGAPLKGCLTECLLHAWTKDSHHHLLERTKESFVVPAQDVVRGISERL